MTMRQRRGDDGAEVLVLANAQHQPFALALFGDGDDQFVVLLDLARPKDQQRQPRRPKHLAQRGPGVGGAVVRREREQDQVRARVFGGLGPNAGVIRGVAPGFHQQRRPILGSPTPNLQRGERWIGDLPFKLEERQRRLTANGGDGAACPAVRGGRAQRDLPDLAVPPFLGYLYWHRICSLAAIVRHNHTLPKLMQMTAWVGGPRRGFFAQAVICLLPWPTLEDRGERQGWVIASF